MTSTPKDRLLAVQGPAAGETAAIDAELVLGRASVHLPALAADELLSRRHARVFRDSSGGLRIADLGSRNGTYVNDARITDEQPLSRGDRVRVGASVFEVHGAAEGREPPTPHGAAAAAAVLIYEGRRTNVGAQGVSIGRDPASDVVISDDLVSRHHARVDHEADGYTITDLGSRNGVYVNGEHLVGATRPLRSGDTVVIGGKTLRFVIGGGETRLGIAAPVQAAPQTIRAPRERLTLGRDAHNDLVLDDPNVSRFHAEIVAVPDGFELRDLGSRNGTRLDTKPVARALLHTGSEIAIGPFRLVFDGAAFVARDERGALRLDAYDVEVHAGRQTILEPTTLSILPGQFVVIIGEAGSGKSTLIKALAGVSVPTKGSVLVNGEPVLVRLSEIGYVPQFDIVHPTLTAREALTYAAMLRLPLDSDDREIRQAVDHVLEELELHREEDPDSKNQTPIEDRLVLSLSGGQRKRVSVGTELVSRPGLIFLDEPTSGLDPRLERIMMENMRHLADQGRAVVTITHATGNLRLADRVLVMGRGGTLCFDGTPKDALEFFGVSTYEGIYDALTQRKAREWRAEWDRRAGAAGSADRAAAPDASAAAVVPETTPDAVRAHARTLTARAVRLLFRDRRNLAVLLGAGPLLSLLILQLPPDTFEAGQSDPRKVATLLFFMLMIVLFLATTAGAREVVKEREVFARESAVGVPVQSYVLSKVAILFAVATTQALTVSAIIFGQRPGVANTGVILMLLGTGYAGVVMGLVISALSKSESQATSLIPLALLPQIMFSGLTVPFKDLPEVLTYPASGRWSLQGTLNAADFGSRWASAGRRAKEANPFRGTDFLELPWPVPLVILLAVTAALLAFISWWLRRETPAGRHG